MRTAKSVQLTDGSNVNISPMTDLMSVYYEVQTNDNIIARKYIYNDFPVGVSYVDVSLDEINVSIADMPAIINIGDNQKLQYKKDGKNYDVTVSNVSVRKLAGTNYNVIESNTYNLSNILYNYKSKYAFDQDADDLYNYIDTKINAYTKDCSIKYADIYNKCLLTKAELINVNASIYDVSTRIKQILNTYSDEYIYSYAGLQPLVNDGQLIANKVYGLYYQPDESNINIQMTSYSGIISVNDVSIFNDAAYPFYVLYLKAASNNDFYPDVLSICGVDTNDNVYELNWDVKYDFNRKTITWMKDEYNNSAPYDFKHTVSMVSNKWLYTFSKYSNNTYIDLSKTGDVQNNTITDNTYMPVFISDTYISDNDCVCNKFVYIDANNIGQNIIKNSNVIFYKNSQNIFNSDFINNIIQNSNILFSFTSYTPLVGNGLKYSEIINANISVYGTTPPFTASNCRFIQSIIKIESFVPNFIKDISLNFVDILQSPAMRLTVTQSINNILLNNFVAEGHKNIQNPTAYLTSGTFWTAYNVVAKDVSKF